MKVYIIKTTFIATVKGIMELIDEDCMSILFTDYKEAYNAMNSLALKHRNNSGYTTTIKTDNAYGLCKKSLESKAFYQIMIEVIEKEI